METKDEPQVFVALVRHGYGEDWPTVKIATSQAALERKVADLLLEEGRLLKAAEEGEDEDAVAFVERVRQGDPLWDVIRSYCEATEWEVCVDWIGLYLPAVEVTDALDELLM